MTQVNIEKSFYYIYFSWKENIYFAREYSKHKECCCSIIINSILYILYVCVCFYTLFITLL